MIHLGCTKHILRQPITLFAHHLQLRDDTVALTLGNFAAALEKVDFAADGLVLACEGHDLGGLADRSAAGSVHRSVQRGIFGFGLNQPRFTFPQSFLAVTDGLFEVSDASLQRGNVRP